MATHTLRTVHTALFLNHTSHQPGFARHVPMLLPYLPLQAFIRLQCQVPSGHCTFLAWHASRRGNNNDNAKKIALLTVLTNISLPSFMSVYIANSDESGGVLSARGFSFVPCSFAKNFLLI